MILADTSAWIEYDRATGRAVDRRMLELVAESDDLAVTEPVIMEVLAGARTTARADDLRRLLLRHRLLRCDSAVDFEGAATIYRACRRSGITPRGLLDCLIVAVAARHRASVLSVDVDVERVAGTVGVTMDPGLTADPV